MSIDLPISKSIANRILMLQAIHGDPLMEVSCDMPDDVQIIHDALCSIHPTTCYLKNCGTALRFLTAYFAQLPGFDVVVDGEERLRERPINQLVDVLRQCGAQIEYLDRDGYAPLRIKGVFLVPPSQPIHLPNPLSTQMISALLLIGIPVETNRLSPYIDMTKSLIEDFHRSPFTVHLEADWSAAAFWYEYISIHGGELELKGLKRDSLQGDRVVADLFRPLGVETMYTPTGVRIVRTRYPNTCSGKVDFSMCPDLYPALAITYRYWSKSLRAKGTEALHWKESDRLEAVATLSPRHDHRMAMALMAADLPCDDIECINKSYPQFVQQLSMLNEECKYSVIVPRRGVNDDHKGKKYALHTLIAAASTPYVWLQDDDVLSPTGMNASSPIHLAPADLYILPLRMQGNESLLSKLQIAEYAAIQEITMRTAKRGRAIMCSGANLLVNRERWLESYADLHSEIASGDDMFLLESFRRRGLRIIALDSPAYTATVSAQTTWKAFLRQRMRWAGKAPHYTDTLIRRYGAWVLTANMLQFICPPILLFKFPWEYSLIKKRDPGVSFWIALLLEIVYPYYVLLSLFGGLCRLRRFRSNW